MIHTRLPHAVDAIVTIGSAIVTCLSAIFSTSVEDFETRAILIPLVGSMIVSGGFIMLNPQIETRRIVIGRSMLALVIGVCAPQLFPANWITKPAILILLGGFLSGLAYIMSKPFCARLYEQAESRGRAAADELLSKLPMAPVLQETKKEVSTTTTTTLLPPPIKPEEKHE